MNSSMEKRQTIYNRIGKILIGIMSIDIILLIIFTIFSSQWEITNSFREVLSWELVINYPLGPITYLLPFLSVIYLSIITSTKKTIKYIIGILSVLILSIIVLKYINSQVYILTRMYDYYTYDTSSNVDVSKLNTWYNLIDFIIGK